MLNITEATAIVLPPDDEFIIILEKSHNIFTFDSN